MKKALFLRNSLIMIFFICSITFNSYASEQDSLTVLTKEHLATAQVDRLTRELSLTKAQSQEIYQILVKRIETIRQAHDKKLLSDERINKVNDNLLKQLETVLTPAQLALYNHLAAELSRQKKAYHANKKQPEIKLEDRMLNLQ